MQQAGSSETGTSSTQGPADLRGLNRTLEQAAKLVHELCRAHQVPTTLDSRPGSKAYPDELDITQDSFARAALVAKAEAQVQHIMKRSQQRSEARRQALAMLMQHRVLGRESKDGAEEDSDEQGESSGDGEGFSSGMSSSHDSDYDHHHEEFDAKTWRVGIEALLAKMDAQSEWATAATLRQHFRQQSAAQRLQRMGVVDDLENEHKNAVLNFSHAQHTMDREISESQMRLFTMLGNFNSGLHSRTLQAVEARERRKAEARKSRALDNIIFMDRPQKGPKKEDEQAPVPQPRRQVSEAADLMTIISDQQNQIAALEGKSRVANDRVKAHEEAAAYLKQLAKLEEEGSNQQLPPPSPAVEDLLTDFFSTDSRSRMGSTARGALLEGERRSGAGAAEGGAEGDTSTLEAEVEYLKEQMEELQQGMEVMGQPNSPRSPARPDAAAQPAGKMSRRERLNQQQAALQEKPLSEVVPELQSVHRQLTLALEATKANLERMQKEKEEFFATIAGLPDVSARLDEMEVQTQIEQLSRNPSRVPPEERGPSKSPSVIYGTAGGQSLDPSAIRSSSKNFAGPGVADLSRARSNVLAAQADGEQTSNKFMDWTIMETRLVRALGKKAPASLDEGESVLKGLSDEEAVLQTMVRKLGEAKAAKEEQEKQTKTGRRSTVKGARGSVAVPNATATSATAAVLGSTAGGKEGGRKTATATAPQAAPPAPEPQQEKPERKAAAVLDRMRAPETETKQEEAQPTLSLPATATRSVKFSGVDQLDGPTADASSQSPAQTRQLSIASEMTSQNSQVDEEGSATSSPRLNKRGGLTSRPVISGDKVVHPGLDLKKVGSSSAEVEMLQRLLQLQDENLFISEQIRKYDERAHALKRGQPLQSLADPQDGSSKTHGDEEVDGVEAELVTMKAKMKGLQKSLMRKRRKWQNMDGAASGAGQRRASIFGARRNSDGGQTVAMNLQDLGDASPTSPQASPGSPHIHQPMLPMPSVTSPRSFAAPPLLRRRSSLTGSVEPDRSST